MTRIGNIEISGSVNTNGGRTIEFRLQGIPSVSNIPNIPVTGVTISSDGSNLS